ncbi:DUF3772 domain-containing protein [Citrobacter sp. JGM124]|uniref:DUF3772 domain-containing protein n=1 Tax=Citrobacter sp. JGM124 TaxID=2799789 RepID=UPI001BA9CB7E|nr:DUF3772 domain-containing protein [Citrobacter sp. JGM124]MBS0848853.1 mechanosensitive ion channel family protein [Citrobacter sp. JGM124]
MSGMLTFVRVCLLTLMTLISPWSIASDNGSTQQSGEAPIKANAAVELPKMQKILDKIKQQVSGETNDTRLIVLNGLALELSSDADRLIQSLNIQQTELQAQLAVLGPVPTADSGVKETGEVTIKRSKLENQNSKTDDQIKQAEAIKVGALNLSAQIVNLRRNALKTQLALNAGSIFSPRFWAPLTHTQDDDSDNISDFIDDLKSTAELSFSPDWILGTVCWILAAGLVATLGRRYLEELLAWIGIHHLPEGRLRRSFLAAATAMTTLGSIVLAFNFLDLAFTRQQEVSDTVRSFADKLVDLSVFCGLIAGLGRAFLSTRRPSWRLPQISDEVALALKPFPPLTATLMFIFQTAENFNSSANTSVATTIFANGMTALLIGATALAISMRTNLVRRRMIMDGQQPEARSTLAGLIQMALTLTGFVIMISLMIGYITLARFLAYELIWMGIVCGLFYIFSRLITDTCESLFSINTAFGRQIQASLNIEARHLSLVAALLSAIGKTLLLLAAAMSLLNGSFGSVTPIELVQKTMEFWGGKGLESMNIVPAQVVNALLCLLVGLWILRSVKRWLENEFLPKTSMDRGMRVSLITLFSNIGFVLLILMTLSIMGLQWNKLAWIVSALSVGIGFGLQEIVKNFISGLILLTERPVKVGDLVSISGIEGDIRRINVRATEIQLSDKSTVIVPNSQLISQNVRNATMGNAQGVATILLTFPLDIDPQKVRQLLLDIYRENERILEMPEPSVSFKDLTSSGIVMSVTGNVASPRHVSSVKSDLLFAILTRLREEGVVLSSPQTMIIERKASQGAPQETEE